MSVPWAPRRTQERGNARLLRTRLSTDRLRSIEPAARREAILDAALTVFAERGFEAARLDDVAARAGVAKGTLYLYFKDKEALFEEVVRSAVSPVVERLSVLAAAPDMPMRPCSTRCSACSRKRFWAPGASSSSA